LTKPTPPWYNIVVGLLLASALRASLTRKLTHNSTTTRRRLRHFKNKSYTHYSARFREQKKKLPNANENHSHLEIQKKSESEKSDSLIKS